MPRVISLTLKWFLGFILLALGGYGLMFLGGVLGLGPQSIFECVGWVVLILLIRFPGPKKEWPRLFYLAEVFWILTFFISALMVAGSLSGSNSEIQGLLVNIPVSLILPELFLPPLLLFTLHRRHAMFRGALLASVLYNFFLYAWGLYFQVELLAAGPLQVLSSAALDTVSAVYMWKKFIPQG